MELTEYFEDTAGQRNPGEGGQRRQGGCGLDRELPLVAAGD